jgi:hypothetical protein
MITISLTISKKSERFVQHSFSVTGIPMNIHNSILIGDELNPPNSPYTDGSFSAKPNGSSYDINFMGDVHHKLYDDTEKMINYMQQCFERIKPKLKERAK